MQLLRSVFRRSFAPPRSTRIPQRNPRGKKTLGSLETLEARCLLTIFNVLNTNDSGSGSLREAILNANGLGADIIQFNIPVTDPNFVTATGNDCDETNNGIVDTSPCWWRITLESALPPLTDSSTEIRGQTQPGNTNPGSVGTIINVGVDAASLTQKARPEVAIDGNGFNVFTINGNASGVIIEGLAIYGATDAIVVTPGVSSHPVAIIRNMLVGVLPNGDDPGMGHRNTETGIEVGDLAQVAVGNSYIGFNGFAGIVGSGNESVLGLLFNEVFENGWNSNDHSGIEINGIDSALQFNYIHDNTNNTSPLSPTRTSGHGIALGSQFDGVGDHNSVVDNTVKDNISAGIAIRNGATGNTISRNVVTENTVGVFVDIATADRTNNNVITQNSIFANVPTGGTGGLGIDLQGSASAASPTYDGVTRNDQGDADAGSNNLANFPILSDARISDTNLILTGFAEPGTLIEFFIADPDPSGFGEGRTFLISRTEGLADDSDAGTGSYGPNVNGHPVSAVPITANRFSFSIPLASLPFAVTEETVLTATGTVSENTSEFAPNVTVNLDLGSLSGFVFEDADNDGDRDGSENGISGVTIQLIGIDDLGNVVDVTDQTNNNGQYTLNNLRPGVYAIIETQPVGFADGKDSLGTLGGNVAEDRFTGIVVGTGDHGTDYNFGELATLPAASEQHTFRIFPGTRQQIEVRLLSGPGFDPGDIDFSKVRLGDAQVTKSRRGRDINGDGKRDAILYFKTRDTGLLPGATTVRLMGEFESGQVFAVDLSILSLKITDVPISRHVKRMQDTTA